MVSQEAIGVAEPVRALHDLGDEGKKALPVCVIRGDGSARVAAAGHMIQSARTFETQGSCHRRIMEEGENIRFRPGLFVHRQRFSCWATSGANGA